VNSSQGPTQTTELRLIKSTLKFRGLGNARESRSLKCFGIVKLRTRAYNQSGDLVLEFDRVIAVPRRVCGGEA